jgi:hypothetical protein
MLQGMMLNQSQATWKGRALSGCGITNPVADAMWMPSQQRRSGHQGDGVDDHEQGKV